MAVESCERGRRFDAHLLEHHHHFLDVALGQVRIKLRLAAGQKQRKRNRGCDAGRLAANGRIARKHREVPPEH
jgi:hypothetical protein